MTLPVNEMKIKALAPWFGAKRNLAPRIVELLGSHSVYWEPFCGSMAVLMVKPTCRMETVNDLHGDLINLATVIQNRDTCLDLYKRLRHVLMHEGLMEKARLASNEPFEPGVDRAYWYFLASWISRNGQAGLIEKRRKFCRRFSAKGGSPAVRLISAIGSIPAWRRRLNRVCILQMDAIEVLDRIDDAKDTAIYVDPPYFKKGAKYEYGFTPEDHDRLAEALHRFKNARIILSYYKHPRVDELYPDWDQEEIEITKKLGIPSSKGHIKAKAIEVLLCSQTIDRTHEQVSLFGAEHREMFEDEVIV